MKKLFVGIAVLLVLGMVMITSAFATKWQVHGKHYGLNILGVAKGKEVGDSKGHTMFVKLNGHTKIIMTQAEDGEFLVVDRNGTDGTAEFNIAPGYYNVYAIARGRPGGKAKLEASGEFQDALDGSVVFLLGTVNLTRDKKSPQSLNINELLYVDVTLCTAIFDPTPGSPNSGDEVCIETTTYTDTWVFDIDELLAYWWDYYNGEDPDGNPVDGIKQLQVRFYPCTLDPTGAAPDYCRWANGDPIESVKTVAAPAAPGVANLMTTWGDIKGSY